MSAGGLLAAGLLISTAAGSSTCLGLDDAITRAFDVSAQVGEAMAARSSAIADFDDALSLRRPQISAFTRSSLGDQGLADAQIENQVGLRASQRLIDFGDARRARASARSAIAGGDAALMVAMAEEAAAVSLAYLDILEARAELAVIAARADYFREQAAVIDELIDEGLATRSEQIEVEAQRASAALDVAARELEAGAGAQQLSARTGLDGVTACPEDALPDWLQQGADAVGAATDSVAMASPDLAAARAERRRLEADYQRARRSRLPAVELVAIGSYAYDDRRDEWAFRDRFGIDVSIPLYGGSSLSAATDRARAARDSAVTRERSLRFELEAQAARLRARLVASEVQRVHLERLIALQSERVAAMRRELELSLTTLTEIIEARLALEDAQLRLVAARFAVLRDRVSLRALTADFPAVTAPPEPEFPKIWGWEPDPED